MLTCLILINPYSNLWGKESCLYFTLKKLRLREAKHFSKSTQLGGIRARICPQGCIQNLTLSHLVLEICRAHTAVQYYAWRDSHSPSLDSLLSAYIMICKYLAYQIWFLLFIPSISQRSWHSFSMGIQTRRQRPNVFWLIHSCNSK